MNAFINRGGLFALALVISCSMGCKTDPIVPAGGIPADPAVQDPGSENLCAASIISFQHEVLPILISSCAYSGCHDAASHKEGVVLDSYAKVMRTVNPGKASRSKLYRSITSGGEEFMPPRPAAPLNADQIATIRDWIDQGANNTDCGTPCDAGKSSFAADIFPMLQNYCVGCHSSNRTEGNVNLGTYQNIRRYAESGALIGTISHDAYYPAMPPSGSKLSDCRITQLKKWIDEGMQNN